MPLVVGNLGIVLSLAWLGPSQLGMRGLILTGLVSILLYNGSLYMGRRAFESRRARNEAQAISVSSGDLDLAPRTKKAVSILLVVVGLVILVIGGILPNRLPRDERNIGSEAISRVVAAGFIYGAAYIDRKQRR